MRISGICLIALYFSNLAHAFFHSQSLPSQRLGPRHFGGLGVPHLSPISLNERTRNATSIQPRLWISGQNEKLQMRDFRTVTYVPTNTPELIYLRPRGSRTVNAKGERPFPSRTFPHLPSEVVGIWPALFFLRNFLAMSVLLLIYLFSSLQGIWRAFESAANAWQGFLFVMDNLSLDIAQLAFSIFWIWIIRIIRGLYLALIHTSAAFGEWVLSIELFIERGRIRQWERQVRECIRRKSPNKLPPRIQREAVKHSGSPLFDRKSLGSLTYLFLPEEKRVLTRHVYDPRYFNQVKKIGAGAFGSIFLVEHRITGKLMAMKVLPRSENTSDEVDLEIRAMIRLQGLPWYPKLLSTFMDADNFYILMPYYCRGDLYAYMTTCGGCLHRELARFYLAELFLAIQGLHQSDIIHRDLKPENILFGEDSHLVLADYGVATVFMPNEDDAFMEDEFPLWAECKKRGGDDFPLLSPSIDNPHAAMGVSGTVYYAAPEVLEGKEYSYGVDYYSMAMLYHEMVTGYVPLRVGPLKSGTDEPELIVDLGRKDIHLQYMSLTDLHFMEKMLNRDPFARPNVRQMKVHPVFAGIDWDKLARREIPIPGPLALRKKVSISPAFEPVPTEQYGRRQ